MADFLLELLSEEIPARMQRQASRDLGRLFEQQLAAAGLAAGEIRTWSTPRRLALVATELPLETAAAREERKGPRADAPPAAIEGFLRSTGLVREQLTERPDSKGNVVLFATIERPGRATSAVLAEAVPAILRDFPWPKSMRWGADSVSTDSLRWVRPLQAIVALLDETIVEFEVAGIRSGAATVGHRFRHPGAITIGSARDYAEKLRACHVVLDPEERAAIIEEGARAAAAAAGVNLVEDRALAIENAGLTEWPLALAGGFDPAFLAVPPEVIQLTMRTNQKYFACTDAEGKLAPRFVCIANIDPDDGGAAIVAGNEKVLAARLSDAKFFWEHDLAVPLAQHAPKLEKILFHEKLGSMAMRVERVAMLARWLVERGLVRSICGGSRLELAAQAEQAARLAKMDLVSEMVGEFPELQGTIGGYLASAQGEPPAVAEAIRDHYKPAGQGDEVPAACLSVAVSLADKLDTLVAFFSIGERPSGSRDPFALRRQAIGVLQLLIRNGIRAPLRDLIVQAAVLLRLSQLGAIDTVSFPQVKGDEEDEITAEVGSFTYRRGEHVLVRWDANRTPNLVRGTLIEEASDLEDELFAFFVDRLKVQQREAGMRHDLIDAVYALDGEDDVLRILARVTALQTFLDTSDGANLLAGYKRAANILRKEDYAREHRIVSFSYTPEKEEDALDSALDQAEPSVDAAIAREDFAGAMAIIAGLRRPIDDFFDRVTVNDPDPHKREIRLALLARIREAVLKVADFSKIEG